MIQVHDPLAVGTAFIPSLEREESSASFSIACIQALALKKSRKLYLAKILFQKRRTD